MSRECIIWENLEERNFGSVLQPSINSLAFSGRREDAPKSYELLRATPLWCNLIISSVETIKQIVGSRGILSECENFSLIMENCNEMNVYQTGKCNTMWTVYRHGNVQQTNM